MATIKGCHLVGSVPLADTETVFKTCTQAMPNRLKRLPDGETGARQHFIACQGLLFPPAVQCAFHLNKLPEFRDFSPEQVNEGLRLLEKADMKTGYDDAALASYAVFRQLKQDGVIPADVRFQVSLPALGSVVSVFVQKAFQPRAEQLYEAAMFDAMRNIQEGIPHGELAIQLDLAVDMFHWEGAWGDPWWGDREHLVGYVARMADQVDKDVELGFHFCYGDMDHRHLIEPQSLKGVADFCNAILDKAHRPASFVHCPVPLSAMDKLDSYFEPLGTLTPRLKEDGADLYLGLVHENKMDSTRAMIEAASKAVPEFGVATECGWGRTPEKHIQSILDISTAVSQPHGEPAAVVVQEEPKKRTSYRGRLSSLFKMPMRLARGKA